MTVRELFEWCKEHRCEDYEFKTTNGWREFDTDPCEEDIDRENCTLVL